MTRGDGNGKNYRLRRSPQTDPSDLAGTRSDSIDYRYVPDDRIRRSGAGSSDGDPEFARQAGLQIIAPADKLKGVKTHSLHGAIDSRAALKLLLEGTGLTVASDDGHTISLRFPEGAGNTTSKVTPAAGAGRLAAAGNTLSSAGQTAAANPQASAAAAQNSSELGEIVVTGIRSSITTARAIKRDSQGIVDAIAPEDIGKLPDTNLAESLQRITGVSIDRSGGEGEFITIRGFGPEFNTVLLNGRQMATATDPTQASGRAFSFDVLASELVSGVEVYKSSTARLQSGGVGSTVNIKTARPFDYSGFKFSGSADMNHDENTGKSAPDASFLISDLFADGKFGALVSGSYQKRHDELKAATTDGWIVNAARRLRRSTVAPASQKPRAIRRVTFSFLKISAVRSNSKPASASAVLWSCNTSRTII